MSTKADQRASRRLFPMHMTPFEAYMLLDDSPRYPMTFILQFEFEGDIDRSAFQSAVDQALQRQPMLRAIVAPAKGGRDCWILPEQYNSQVLWGEFHAPINQPTHIDYIDLRREIGFRCWVRHNERRARCVFLFHHAAVDGIAAYQVVGDILWFYATGMGATLQPLPDVDPTELRNRLRNNLSAEILKPSPPDERRLAIDRIRQPVAPLSNHCLQFDSEVPGHFPDILTLDFDKDQFRDLRLQAQERGQSINDALLESLFVALAQWNRAFKDDTIRGKICVNMPLDLRNDEEPQFMAANYVSYALVQRSSDEILDTSDFLEGLRNDLAHLKHTRFNSSFMRFLLEISTDESENASQLLDKEGGLATLVFSNTGDPTRRFWVKLPRADDGLQCGNLVLVDVSGSPPLRKDTRVALGVLTYQRKLRICIRSDRQYFSEPQTRLFLEHFAELFVSRKHNQLSTVLREAIENVPLTHAAVSSAGGSLDT
ncbi:MAG TPA: chromosome condensation protein [Pirellulaceae bacterium]|nr:chromosome condensation protein [Pirellulaceae bacterium]HMO91484.1 chromosome condensation protein [Pirellulaceae bacterium]HMP70997.1 chromosome condensation protein [Pirellulaceae bacterium]